MCRHCSAIDEVKFAVLAVPVPVSGELWAVVPPDVKGFALLRNAVFQCRNSSGLSRNRSTMTRGAPMTQQLSTTREAPTVGPTGQSAVAVK